VHDHWRKSIGKLTIADTRLAARKMKYVLEPIVFIPTGQICDATIEPIEPPEAAKLRPRARKLVGKIWGIFNIGKLD
jgi:hypothetical protein